MRMDPHILLWSYAEAHVLDIRHLTLEPGEELRAYLLPANGFLYATRGKARILLDGLAHKAERFHVLHGGKGMCLDILPIEQNFEYYLIFYKAALTLAGGRRARQLMDQHNPFQIQYGFAPRYPVALYSQVDRMFQEWRQSAPLTRLNIKGMFYQFVHEIFRQLREQGIHMTAPDPVEQVIRYMHEHYANPITLEALSEKFECSPRSLRRLFKKRTGTSPIDYVLAIRINKAKEMLLRTDATLKEIASQIGYPDGYYLSRVFKNFTGLSPMQFKAQMNPAGGWPNLPSPEVRYTIVQDNALPYINNDNYYQYKNEGESTMHRNVKPSLAVVMLLCFSLILSACGAAPAANGTNAGGTSQSVTEAKPGTEAAEPAEAATRIISTVKGDIEVPANPQRIVANYVQGNVLALGMNLVAASKPDPITWFYEEVKDLPSIESFTSPEEIMSYDPDLIFTVVERDYEALKDVAPTILIPTSLNVEELVLFMGEVLGRTAEAEAKVKEFRALTDEGKAELREAGVLDKTVTLLEGMSVAADKHGRGGDIIYNKFGMKAPEIIQKEMIGSKDNQSRQISFEVLPQYAGDLIIMGTWDGMEPMAGNAVWDNLPAVKENRVIEAPFALTFFTDINSSIEQVKFFTDALLEKAKVDK